MFAQRRKEILILGFLRASASLREDSKESVCIHLQQTTGKDHLLHIIKKAGPPCLAARLSLARPAAFRPELTLGLAFSGHPQHYQYIEDYTHPIKHPFCHVNYFLRSSPNSVIVR
jgi:hypothetical protein